MSSEQLCSAHRLLHDIGGLSLQRRTYKTPSPCPLPAASGPSASWQLSSLEEQRRKWPEKAFKRNENFGTERVPYVRSVCTKFKISPPALTWVFWSATDLSILDLEQFIARANLQFYPDLKQLSRSAKWPQAKLQRRALRRSRLRLRGIWRAGNTMVTGRAEACVTMPSGW